MTRPLDGEPLRRLALAALCAIALLQIALGLAGLVAAAAGVEWARPTAVRDWQRAVQILAFSGLAARLLLGSRRDPRAAHLGALLLLIAVFFARPPILALTEALPPPGRRFALLLRAIPVDAFTPALAWLFVRDFPRALESPRTATFVRAMISIALAAALGLVAANLAVESGDAPAALAPLSPADPYSHYWTIVFGLLLPVLPFSLWRTRHALPAERRRVAFFAGGLVVAGLLPVLVAVLPPLLPQLRRFTRGSEVVVLANQLMILAVAGVTTYSVLVQRVLPLRTVLRKAAQYWLAACLAAVLAGIPFALLAALLYRARSEPLESLFRGTRPIAIAALLALGVAVLHVRRQVMLAVDRVFLREPYDTERLLAALAAEARAAGSREDLARVVVDRLQGALHPESVGIVVATESEEGFLPASPAIRRLPKNAALGRILAHSGGPLEVDLVRPVEALRDLPEAERFWLSDASACMLVPLMGSARELQGILVLGPKRSELPYSRQDLLLLEAVGGTAGIGLENRRLRGAAAPYGTALESRASECPGCGRIATRGEEQCIECGKPMDEAALPKELFGKFRLERRIGVGGMGVVYGATDLTLGRHVALKTLPRTSPEDAARLRREARAMAAITHPNLALILGAETWQGIPVLVLEYLGGGTLDTRLARGPLSSRESLEIAWRMARVLERLHRSGLLHRDVKPSNLGFTEEGEPKLLDFGLARILGDVVPAQIPASAAPPEGTGFAGTPLYMSPEALDDRRPEPGFDLWGLAVVAFEAVTGSHPFERASPAASLEAIYTGWTEELRVRLPAHAGAAGDLFASALAAERSRRPGTASELAESLRETADRITA